nr:MAG TPA: hypothetical protein [Caudoviricetes sp.]
MREICFSTPIKVLLAIPATAVLFNFVYHGPHNSSLLLALFVRLFYLILCFWPTTYLFCPKFYTIFGATYTTCSYRTCLLLAAKHPILRQMIIVTITI